MHRTPCVVLVGDFSTEQLAFDHVAHEFGWSVLEAADIEDARDISRSIPIVAVLLHAESFAGSFIEAASEIGAFAPHARVIPCLKANDSRWAGCWSDAGIFAALLSPLNRSELRQTLGFLWSARNRVNKEIAQGLPLRMVRVAAA